MAHRFTKNWTAQLPDEEDVEVVVTFTATPYVPAQVSGPPENCYPAEGGEIEIEEVVREDSGDLVVLSASEEQRLIDYLMESLDDDDFNPEPDWDDRDFDGGF